VDGEASRKLLADHRGYAVGRDVRNSLFRHLVLHLSVSRRVWVRRRFTISSSRREADGVSRSDWRGEGLPRCSRRRSCSVGVADAAGFVPSSAEKMIRLTAPPPPRASSSLVAWRYIASLRRRILHRRLVEIVEGPVPGEVREVRY